MSAIQVVRTDITILKVDAIVNAANNSLRGGGGVDGAIHAAAGSGLLRECITIGGCPTGQARVSKGYNLPARYVIHTVGPIWQGGNNNEAELLTSCYRECFRLARGNNIATIAFPAISCGVYGYPKDQACALAMSEAIACLADPQSIKKIIFSCCNDTIEKELLNNLPRVTF